MPYFSERGGVAIALRQKNLKICQDSRLSSRWEQNHGPRESLPPVKNTPGKKKTWWMLGMKPHLTGTIHLKKVSQENCSRYRKACEDIYAKCHQDDDSTIAIPESSEMGATSLNNMEQPFQVMLFFSWYIKIWGLFAVCAHDKLLYFVWSPPWHLYILLLANLSISFPPADFPCWHGHPSSGIVKPPAKLLKPDNSI